ncbi:hypothetical protein Lal_00003463 [Lupinus albus]|uniref:Putative transcription factor MADS-type1 family n=1 Tax=Lupinus albus TaxID=3870 RepID=A0A6A4Q3R3_LUPAL|nr:putative transcription factor MADS-type1 family [Lupinus albus]KAF1870257.1 hypothetical protein Lal_00003463 [Lupinus albus]
MGRSRLTLKRIENDACRKSTFKQRRDVLLNKMKELSNLCNAEEGEAANACLIVYDTNGGEPQPMTWPENLKPEHSLIQRFENEKNKESPIMFGIQDYFKNKKDKVEADISKVKKEIVKIQYPTSHPCFNNLGDEQIRNFLAVLDAKGKACIERMNLLRLQQQVELNSTQTSSAALNSSEVNFMQNNFQTQLIPTPLEPFDDSNNTSLKHDIDLQSQMFHIDPNPMQLIANNNGLMDSANQIGVPLDCATQVSPLNHVGVPMDITKQTDPAAVSTNQLDDVDWGSLIDGLIDCDTLPYESVFHDNFSGYQNVQQGAAFDNLTPPVDEFQISDYNTMLQAELFKHINQEK